MSACTCYWAPNIIGGTVVSMTWMTCADHGLPPIENEPPATDNPPTEKEV